MLLASKGLTDGYLTDGETYNVLRSGLDQLDLDGKRILVLVPDKTRSCPMPMLFRALVDLLAWRTARLDFLICLGTHPPMSQPEINRLVGVSDQERTSTYHEIGIYNHAWPEAGTFMPLGVIPKARIGQITGGLMREDVPIGVNKIIMDYDQLMILGPTFPHEVVGFSAGLKYVFPGISAWEFIHFFHWLSAVITCIKIIGTKHTPVRELINEAAKLVPKPILNINLVVRGDRLAGCYIGDAKEAWSHAADLSAKLHIIYEDRPYKLVIGVTPEMYDDVWVGGKAMYKLEPIVADGGELIIYAPHVKEISHTHGRVLDRIGYHVRDYYLKQMDRFRDVPGGIMAHSTHVRGLGTFENGTERSRITVSLATSIPRQRVEKVSLKYRDYRSINVDDYRNRQHEGILVVDHAGEVLHRLKRPSKQVTIPD